MVYSALTSVTVGIIFFVLGIPFIFKLIPPNPLYGFRTRSTLDNEELWYPVNKNAGIDMVVLGIIFILLPFIPFVKNYFTICFIPVMLMGLAFMLFRGFAYIHNYNKTVKNSRTDVIRLVEKDDSEEKEYAEVIDD